MRLPGSVVGLTLLGLCLGRAAFFCFGLFDFDHHRQRSCLPAESDAEAGGWPCVSFCFAFCRSVGGLNFVAEACGFCPVAWRAGGGIKSSHARLFRRWRFAFLSLNMMHTTPHHTTHVSIRKQPCSPATALNSP